jgi:hypothetical protein
MPLPVIFRFFPSTSRSLLFTATTIFAIAFPADVFLRLLRIRTLPCTRSIYRDLSAAFFADLALLGPHILLRPTRN